MQLVCLLTALLVGLVAAWPDAPCRPTPPIGGYSDDLVSIADIHSTCLELLFLPSLVLGAMV